MNRQRVTGKSNLPVMTKKRGRLPPIPDYNNYILSRGEIITHFLMGGIFMAIVSFLMYDSIYVWFVLMAIVVLSLNQKKKELCIKRKLCLEKEFRDVILSVSSNLQAGYSIENAFGEAYKDIVLLYGKKSLMANELELMMRRLGNNELLEDILSNLSGRSGVDDIKNFADIFHIAKRSGGDIRSIIANTASIISDKQEVRREIDTVITEKKLELMIMRYIPFMIIYYISLTTKGYFECMYHNLSGWILMTIGFAVYMAACHISDRILEIEV
ncbi:MAG: type II secretion system F family protein [Lachnospiraceae bacterium]|nr:type II secretion system F family protein [Lachnospiraceae bacterium]